MKCVACKRPAIAWLCVDCSLSSERWKWRTLGEDLHRTFPTGAGRALRRRVDRATEHDHMRAIQGVIDSDVEPVRPDETDIRSSRRIRRLIHRYSHAQTIRRDQLPDDIANELDRISFRHRSGTAGPPALRSAAAMKGQPMYFACPEWRRVKNQLRFSQPSTVHRISLTGRTKKKPRNRYAASGHRMDSVSREYVCSCGHRGWSAHFDLKNVSKVSVAPSSLRK